MEEIKDLLEEFVDWAKDCGEDAWYIFDNTEEAIERFLKQREQLLLLAITSRRYDQKGFSKNSQPSFLFKMKINYKISEYNCKKCLTLQNKVLSL